MKIKQKKIEKQISDICLEVENLNDFLSKLQLRAERAFIEQENSHELTEEYIILFQGGSLRRFRAESQLVYCIQ